MGMDKMIRILQFFFFLDVNILSNTKAAAAAKAAAAVDDNANDNVNEFLIP